MTLKAPLRHISIRVPWHDARWNGTVCCGPKLNTACLKLVNIAENKIDEAGEADLFCTCDDSFLKKAKREVKGRTKVVSPLELAEEIEKWQPQQDC